LQIIHELRSLCRLGAQISSALQFAESLVEIGDEFSKLAENFSNLKKNFFDADLQSVKSIELQAAATNFAANGLQAAARKEKFRPPKNFKFEVANFNFANRNLAEKLDKFSAKIDSAAEISAAKIWKWTEELLLGPICVPRYFFQSLYTTEIKLALSPSGTFNLLAGQNLVLKIEGVVEQRGTKRDRHVTRFLVHVNAPMKPENFSMQKFVLAKENYFSTDVLLSFEESAPVGVRVQLEDASGQLWDYPTEQQLRVNVVGGANLRAKRMKIG